MRIISGKLKGHKLISPTNNKIRPTSDRAREMIFSTLESILIKENSSLKNKTVLDGFCGSGAIGIEALSRGAKSVLFADISQKSLDLTKMNCLKVKLCDFITIQKIDLTTYDYKDVIFDIFFLDPPYSKKITDEVMERLILNRSIRSGSIGIIETKSDDEIKIRNNISVLTKKKISSSHFKFLKII